MHKDQTILGMLSQIDWSKTSAEPDGAQNVVCLTKMIAENWPNILRKCASSPEGVTFITQDGLTRLIITATCFEQKKTRGKSGAT
jgi:hypothetical protein